MFPHHPSVYTNSAYRFLYIRVFNTLCTELRLHSLVGNLGSKLLLEHRRILKAVQNRLRSWTCRRHAYLRWSTSGAWIQSCLCGTDANVYSYPGYKASVSIWQQNDSVFINNNLRVTIFVFQILIIKSYMIGFHSSSITKPTEIVTCFRSLRTIVRSSLTILASLNVGQVNVVANFFWSQMRCTLTRFLTCFIILAKFPFFL